MLKLFNVPIDVITMYLIMWNVGLVGMISIHLTAPLFMQQTFLLIMSSMMALTFIKYIPDWSVWTVLGILSVWDVVAVLCPRGPLRILVETAQKRKEPIFPALIYSSGVAYVAPVIASTVLSLGTTTNSSNRASINEMEAASSTQSSNPVHVQIQTNPLDSERTESMNLTGGTGRSNESITYYASSRSSRLPEVNLQSGNLGPAASSGVPAIAISSTTQMIRSTDDEIETNSTCSAEDVGIKLGLGDFIFYSVLVGKASMYNDWNTTLACFVAILIGLCLTLFLLAIFNKALPALPISISFGLIFYFCTSIFVQPLADQYSMQNIFI